MKDYTMDQYTMQSYFKSLCNSFCIVYKQVKRLEAKKREVETIYPEEKCRELEFPTRFWTDRQWNIANDIESIIKMMIEKEYTIIVTTEEEIIALMDFFSTHSVARNDVINTDEESLKDFPKGKKMYKEFLDAYSMDLIEAMTGIAISDNTNIKEVIKKYL